MHTQKQAAKARSQVFETMLVRIVIFGYRPRTLRALMFLSIKLNFPSGEFGSLGVNGLLAVLGAHSNENRRIDIDFFEENADNPFIRMNGYTL